VFGRGSVSAVPLDPGVMLSSRSIWHGADAQLRQPIVTIRTRSFETKVSQDDFRSGVAELSHYLVLGAPHRSVFEDR
jgi:hypothetical protein